MEKVVKDYIKISYRDGGILYVLATGLDVIQKYASADAKVPKLNKLGTAEWVKVKNKTKAAVNEVARIWLSCMPSDSRVKAIPMERILSGSGNSRSCFLMKKLRISFLPLKPPRRTWKAKRSWTV